MKKVWLYKNVNDKIVCEACKHFCTLKEGEWGKCGVRVNKNQELYLSVYNKASSLNIDPIEKKPLFHFLPSSSSLSIGTVGCNFGCDFCQNYSISQYPKENNHRVFGKEVDAVTLIDIAKEYQTKSISYTYNEPAVFFEYAYECAKRANENGIKNIKPALKRTTASLNPKPFQ
jgi:pyruvate formate lyase activating enzyme